MPTKVYIVKAMVFPVIMYGRVGPGRRVSTEELMFSNCGKALERPLDSKQIKPVNP